MQYVQALAMVRFARYCLLLSVKAFAKEPFVFYVLGMPVPFSLMSLPAVTNLVVMYGT